MPNLKPQKGRRIRENPPRSLSTPQRATFFQQENLGSLLVTAELDKALEECKSRVAEIVKGCRERNMKFRYICVSIATGV
jgi:hypothetical protein